MTAVLRAAINDETLAPGEVLPTKRDLARVHGVSPEIIERAMKQLVAENLVVKREGRRFVVAAPGLVSLPGSVELTFIWAIKIFTEDYHVGTALPTLREMTQSYGVSLAAGRRAIPRLVDAGLLRRRGHSMPPVVGCEHERQRHQDPACRPTARYERASAAVRGRLDPQLNPSLAGLGAILLLVSGSAANPAYLRGASDAWRREVDPSLPRLWALTQENLLAAVVAAATTRKRER